MSEVVPIYGVMVPDVHFHRYEPILDCDALYEDYDLALKVARRITDTYRMEEGVDPGVYVHPYLFVPIEEEE